MSNYANVVRKKLVKIRNAFANNTINELAIRNSLKWIEKRAEKNLQQRLNYPVGTFATNIHDWTIDTTLRYKGTLENDFENSASVEFGIGLVGQMSPAPEISQSNIPYQYNIPSSHKNQLGQWTFKDSVTGIWITFNGYQGKSFLWDAFCEYINNNIWQKQWQHAFDIVVGGICK